MCLSKGLNAVREAIDVGLLPNKTLAFIPTAGDTYEDPYFVRESRVRLEALGLTLVELDAAHEPAQQLADKLDRADGVFIAGGNSFYLLEQLRRTELDKRIREKVKNSFPYFGESAGAVILVHSIEMVGPIDDPDKAPGLTDYTALGLIDFFPLPHVNQEKYQNVFEQFMRDNEARMHIVRYRDDQAIFTKDGKNYELLDSNILPVK